MIKDLSPDSLNIKRKQAVTLRLQGYTVAACAKECGLSAPTVIAAFNAFKKGGWSAVAVKPRGRKSGQGQNITEVQREQLKQTLFTQSLSNLAQLENLLSGQITRRSLSRQIEQWGLLADRVEPFKITPKRSEYGRWVNGVLKPALQNSIKPSTQLFVGGVRYAPNAIEGQALYQLYVHDSKGQQYWYISEHSLTEHDYQDFFKALSQQIRGELLICLQGVAPLSIQTLVELMHKSEEQKRIQLLHMPTPPSTSKNSNIPVTRTPPSADASLNERKTMSLTHLQRLEAESIHIMREVVAETENPVMLYSVGKDSAVMLHLARKAFAPGPPPFPLLHIDTRWKFQDMYRFRDKMAKESGMQLLVHINPEGVAKDINPITHGSAIHTDIMKTEGLKQALNQYKFDAAFGGARRDEEKSRAKERIFSFRDAQHHWDPKNQRPELWKLYNASKHKGESIRVFPISNWTELDIWQYIHLENIPIVPLYYAAERPVVERDGTLIMVDDERLPLMPGEVPMMRSIRFRTLGCYPLTGAVESKANTLPAIIQEMLLTHTSERQGRVIDHDASASMEKKKQEGYF